MKSQISSNTKRLSIEPPADPAHLTMNKLLTMRPVIPEDEPFLRKLRAEHDVERLHLQDNDPDMGDLVASQWFASL